MNMNMKKFAVGLMFGIGLTATGSWAASSKCDAAISKAVGKKVSCQCGLYAKAQLKGTAPDSAKLAKCGAKFMTICGKAQTKNDCSVQNGSCANKETQADGASATLCLSSPNAAFVD